MARRNGEHRWIRLLPTCAVFLPLVLMQVIGPIAAISLFVIALALSTAYTFHRSIRNVQEPMADAEHAELARGYDVNARPFSGESETEETDVPHQAAPMPVATDASLASGTKDVPDAAQTDSSFDFNDFLHSLLRAEQPMAYLKECVSSIRERESDDSIPNPSGLERYLARTLDEAGLFAEDGDAEGIVAVIRPHHSGMLYLRMRRDRMAYGSYLRMIRIEAALNAAYRAHSSLEDASTTSMDEVYRYVQRFANSICAQAPNVDTADWSYLAMPWQSPVGPKDGGEWIVRETLSRAIEEAQVPYRLEASYRTNVTSGDVALEFGVTPSQAFPSSAYTSGLGIVPTTSHMRRRECARYAARVGILLANHAFRASRRIRRVWVSAILETPSNHSCLYSVCMDRKDFSSLNMASIPDPVATLRSMGASLDEREGTLRPVTPLFYLEDERFCPKLRHDLWQLSERRLPPSAALSLGTTRVSGLVIHEELPRILAADEILRELGDEGVTSSVERCVQSLMSAADKTSDITVWDATERIADKLVSGAMDIPSEELMREELVYGDRLSKAVTHAQDMIMSQDPLGALSVLNEALQDYDSVGRYRDTSAVAYRCFGSFAERALYNRRHAKDERSVVLVPDAYLVAHLMVSSLLMDGPEEDRALMDEALEHARRALEVAPLSTSSHLGVAACLERSGDLQGAARQLGALLETAYEPQGVGFAYLRMASLQAEMGNGKASLACCHRCLMVCPQLMPLVIAQCHAIMQQEGVKSLQSMDIMEVEETLRKHDIPLSPTQETAILLFDCATASVDAEVFPVARDLMRVIESLTGDDVMHGIRNSLEREPDL